MPITYISVEEEFKKNPELNQDMLDIMREWLNKQPHLPNISDLDIVLFLHSCMYSMERAKNTIDTYYTIRTHVPEIFSSRHPKHHTVDETLEVVGFMILPEKTPSGERVFLARLKNTDPARYIYANATKTTCIMTDIELQEHGTAKGDQIIFDMYGMVFGHLSRFPISILKKYIYYLQEAQPLRLTSLHVINITPYVNKILALIQPFMKDDLLGKLHVHTDMESFYKHIPKTMLPIDYGGNAPSIVELRDITTNKVRENIEYIEAEEKLRVNELLRPGKAKTAGDLFGIEGTFKKLEID